MTARRASTAPQAPLRTSANTSSRTSPSTSPSTGSDASPEAPAAVHFVVLDACVLMPTVLRRLLLRIAANGCFEPTWSPYIGVEWRRNAARLWDIPLETLEEEWASMKALFPSADAGDVAPYETGLQYSDPKDFHVIAAGLAKRARCGFQLTPRVTIMTWNLKDFNRSELKRLGVGVASPDALLAEWLGVYPQAIQRALHHTLADAELVGRPAASLSAVLHGERLYRFKNLLEHAHGV